eukprot:UN03387
MLVSFRLNGHDENSGTSSVFITGQSDFLSQSPANRSCIPSPQQYFSSRCDIHHVYVSWREQLESLQLVVLPHQFPLPQECILLCSSTIS